MFICLSNVLVLSGNVFISIPLRSVYRLWECSSLVSCKNFHLSFETQIQRSIVILYPLSVYELAHFSGIIVDILCAVLVCFPYLFSDKTFWVGTGRCFGILVGAAVVGTKPPLGELPWAPPSYVAQWWCVVVYQSFAALISAPFAFVSRLAIILLASFM